MSNPTNATLIERHDLTPELAIVRVQPDQGLVPSFEPGQFVTLGLPREEPANPEAPGPSDRPRVRIVRRAYSVASPLQERRYLEFLVTLVQGGRLTPRLWTVEQGGRLWMDGQADGHFTLDGVPPECDLVMVATGTGIAPYVSMLRSYRGQGRWRRLVLLHGVRRSADLAYRQELEQMATEDASIIYLPTVSREAPPPQGAWSGLCGRVTHLLDPQTYQRLVGSPLDPAHAHVFLCGNPDMIQCAQEMLAARGFVTATKTTPGNLHFERYW